MSEQQPSSSAKTSKDHRIKIIFLIGFLVVAGVLYMVQQRGLSISGWGDNLQDALKQAKAETRLVVVFFVNGTPSPVARENAKRIRKPANRKALEEGGFIPVIVELSTSRDSETAKQYQIEQLPTLMVIRSDGTERNRHEGEIGEGPFREMFLEYKDTPR